MLQSLFVGLKTPIEHPRQSNEGDVHIGVADLERFHKMVEVEQIIDGYGLTEVWPLGGNCPLSRALHIPEDVVAVECVDPDTGDPVAEGEPGEIVDAELKPSVFEVNSLEDVGVVLGQAPKAGTELVEGSTVRINVSKGPKPVAVPNVVGSPYESAESVILGAGFAVDREDVEATEAAGIVVGQTPPAGTQQAKGSVITLQVSTGPATSQVPDVTSQTEADAKKQLKNSGFEVQVVEEVVDDESLNGLVLSQNPEGGSDLEEGSTVVIVVGHFEAPPEAP